MLCFPSHRPGSAVLLSAAFAAAAAFTFGVPIRAQSDPTALSDSSSSAPSDQPYGYVRVLEGSATLAHHENEQPTPLRMNQPVLVGDLVIVGPGSRLELLLADQNTARLDAESALELVALAASPDRSDRETVLRLHRGNLQLSIADSAMGGQAPNIETPNATIYPSGAGHYRITTDHGDWTEVVARDGAADIATDRGNVQVAAGQDAVIRGTQQSRAAVRSAGGVDRLEQWGASLERQVASADLGGNVDPSLQTQAASLAQYGDWVDYNNAQYWKPSGVDADWSPYWNGDWSYTPSGYSWVSSEPWGYVPYHYGSWEYLPVHGWAWRPGAVFAPAWVYWYWSPSYVGWCPIGYYSGFYNALYPGMGFRFGLYGWAGGLGFRHWNFVGFDHFGHSGWGSFGFHGERMGGRGFERGFVTTDTRRLSPGLLREPGRATAALREAARGRTVADVSRFVARDLRLSADVLGAVRSTRAAAFRGTALSPSTMGGRQTTYRSLASRGTEDRSRASSLNRSPGTERRGGAERLSRAQPGSRSVGSFDQAWRQTATRSVAPVERSRAFEGTPTRQSFARVRQPESSGRFNGYGGSPTPHPPAAHWSSPAPSRGGSNPARSSSGSGSSHGGSAHVSGGGHSSGGSTSHHSSGGSSRHHG
jgi:hypothetical protein